MKVKKKKRMKEEENEEEDVKDVPSESAHGTLGKLRNYSEHEGDLVNSSMRFLFSLLFYVVLFYFWSLVERGSHWEELSASWHFLLFLPTLSCSLSFCKIFRVLFTHFFLLNVSVEGRFRNCGERT